MYAILSKVHRLCILVKNNSKTKRKSTEANLCLQKWKFNENFRSIGTCLPLYTCDLLPKGCSSGLSFESLS